MGWAYFRQNQLENAERYLNAAWTMSQSATIGSRLAQVYEKENKQAFAIQTYAEALSGEGSREGIRERLLQLVNDNRRVNAIIASASSKLSMRRTSILHRSPSKLASANLLLVFTHSPQPDKIIFSGGTPSLIDRFEAAMKSQKFAVFYPDETPQHVVREAILYCGLAGCSVVLVPPSAKRTVTITPPVATEH